MKKINIENLQDILNERYQIAVDTDKRMGNSGDTFLPNNPDYIFYKGMLTTITALGYEYKRENGVHILFY